MRPPRYLVAWMPAFRLERCGWQAEDVAGLIDEAQNAMRIVAHTPAAYDAGVRLGMTASAARARVPEIALVERDAEAEHEDRCALMRCFTALTDRVRFPWPDAVALEISCVTHLWGGESGLVQRVRDLVGELGHHVQVGVADHPCAAYALAVYTPSVCVCLPGQAAHALAPLPLQALEPSGGLVQALRAVGIETVGEFARLDPASVSGRFGEEGDRLHRIGRGQAPSGGDLGWGEPTDSRPSVHVRMAGATSTLQLLFVLPGLLSQLSAQLAERDRAAVRLRLVLRLERGWGGAESSLGVQRVLLPIRVGRPTRSPRTLETLVKQRLDGVRLDAPVEEVGLEVVDSVPDQGWQPGLTDRTEVSEPLPDLLARLMDHLGERAVHGVALSEAWRPEAAWTSARWPRGSEGLAGLVDPGSAVRCALNSDDPVEVQRAWERGLPRPRPVRLLPRPEPISVRTRPQCMLHTPTHVHLPLRGWLGVRRVVGPEHLQGEWWDPHTQFDREYWVVRVQEQTAWLYRDRDSGRWALHGWF